MEKGYCVRWPIPDVRFFDVNADTFGSARQSKLTLYENGIPLGPAHTTHDLLRRVGNGAYSHWGDSLRFSASDNSNPINNGRSYEVHIVLTLPTGLIILPLITGGISGLWLIRLFITNRYITRQNSTRAIVWICIVCMGVLSVASWSSRKDVFRQDMPIEGFFLESKRNHANLYHLRQIARPFWTPVFRKSDGTSMVRIRRLEQPGRNEPSTVNEVVELGDGRYAVTDAYLVLSLPETDEEEVSYDQYTINVPVRVGWPVILVLTIIAVTLFFMRHRLIRSIVNRQSLNQRLFDITSIPTTLGLILLILNGVGFLIPLRNNDIRNERMDDTITMSRKQAESHIPRRSNENDEQYAHRLNLVVNQSMLHYWQLSGVRKYRIRVPIWENYILYAAAQFDNKISFYEFTNPHKALERGVGMCGQHASTLVGFLRENEINAHIVQLTGHTVTTAEISRGIWHVFDPDMGVHLPFPLSEIEKNPVLVEPFYKEVIANSGRSTESKEQLLKHVVDMYGPEGNQIADIWRVDFEKRVYFLKWVIPIALLFPFVLVMIGSLFSRRNSIRAIMRS